MIVAAFGVLFGCGRPGPTFDEVPVRPTLDQLVITGEVALDASMNRTIRAGRIARREVRRPLREVFPLLKGSDVLPGRIVSYVPLTSGFSSKPCEGRRCPGRLDLAEALPQAGVDVVGLASPLVADQGAVEETERALHLREICTTRDSVCTLPLPTVEVAVVDIAAVSEAQRRDAGSRARKLVAEAREEASVVVLSVKLDGRSPRDDRNALLRSISEEAGSDVVLGHHLGPLDGIEVHQGNLILHNAGPLLLEAPEPFQTHAVVYRLHLSASGVEWLEAIPVHLRPRGVRPAFLDEATATLDRLTKRSSAQGLRVEFGRAILELRAP